ncbi:MAG: hypothetical protein H6625_02290 [Bdellovibrionaceae bacterium]|nr:hypothetical protein [Pseudobdellovibrionaceae bacterium]
MNEYLSDGKESWLRIILASHPHGKDREEKISDRASEVNKRLEKYSAANRLDSAKYEQYQDLHRKFHPRVIDWGRETKEDMKKGKSKIGNFILESLVSPSGRCIVHALSSNF